jgi:opacity protein-like surface antigen
MERYMKKFKNVALGVSFLISNIAFAGTMGAEEIFKQSAYVKLGSGGSYSMDANIYADPTYWDASPQGYNANVGKTALYSAAFGYNYSSLLSGDIEYIYRPSYSYSKFQTSTASNTTGFNADKTRHFDLQSNSLMANVYLNGAAISEYLKVTLWNSYAIEAFIGGGLGVGFNETNSFHSVKTTGEISAFVPSNFTTSLAWQLSAGLQLMNTENYHLSAGYRYYNGGNFFSNDYVTDFAVYATPWKGTLQANEFFITLKCNLEA